MACSVLTFCLNVLTANKLCPIDHKTMWLNGCAIIIICSNGLLKPFNNRAKNLMDVGEDIKHLSCFQQIFESKKEGNALIIEKDISSGKLLKLLGVMSCHSATQMFDNGAFLVCFLDACS